MLTQLDERTKILDENQNSVDLIFLNVFIFQNYISQYFTNAVYKFNKKQINNILNQIYQLTQN